MNNTTAYRWWQAPFAHEKLAPILRNNSLGPSTRVLDVGCGPGTNCDAFQGCDYTGFDINPMYIEYAKKRFGRNFLVQDVCTYEPAPNERFDIVLMNSLLHHLDDEQTRQLLATVANLIRNGGSIQIIDLVLPPRSGIPRWLAMNDRGDFPRKLESWKLLFEEHFRTIMIEPFSLKKMGVELWNLVYFKGESR